MLELMGSKKVCRRILGVVRSTAEHKFNVFQIQPSRFYTFGNRYLFLSKFSIDYQHLIRLCLFPV